MSEEAKRREEPMSPDYWLGVMDTTNYFFSVLHELKVQGGNRQVLDDVGEYVDEICIKVEERRRMQFIRRFDLYSPFRRDAPEEWEKKMEG